MLGRTDRRWRQVVLIGFFAVFAVALVGRLAYWQVGRGEWLRAKAQAQVEISVSEPSQRGRIFDRHGSLLATTEYRDLLSAYPKRIPEARREDVVQRLAAILALDGPGAARARDQLASSDPYVILARELTDDQSQRVQAGLADGKLAGLLLEPKPIRVYPNPGGAPGTTLASQLLGFVNREGEGHYGIEERYQQLLGGRPRLETALRDPGGRAIGGTEIVTDPGVPGADLRLTIDASLQLQVEKELYAAWVADKATRVSAVVLDPDTGAVLASASVPGYDANDYGAVAAKNAQLFVDPNISDVYEPGSVMKMFTAAAAFDRGVVDARTPILDSPSLKIAINTIHNSDRKGKGRIPFEDIVAYSRNVGTARVASMLGDDISSAAAVLYDTWTRFGIGRKTGIDLANEVPGIASDPAQRYWAGIDLANRSFGQGVAVTPIQLATGFSVMANGGYRVPPHLVAAVNDEVTQPLAPLRVIDAGLSQRLQDLMVHVVTSVPYYDEGTRIPGYRVGGKTGTAQIWDTARHQWAVNTYNFTFCGFVGQHAPKAVIIVRIHNAKPEVRGVGDFKLGITSYELFRRIATDTIGSLDIPPQQTLPTTASAARP
jgi:cell division protein FtsI (penicillin-binding protein 3)